MNKFNKKLEYALMALRHIQKKSQGLTTAKELAENYNLSFEAVARVLQILSSKGLLKAEHGANGGYSLNVDLKEQSLFDLMETIQGPLGIVKCLHGQTSCQIKKTCTIVSPVQILNSRLMEFYQKQKLYDLVQG